MKGKFIFFILLFLFLFSSESLLSKEVFYRCKGLYDPISLTSIMSKPPDLLLQITGKKVGEKIITRQNFYTGQEGIISYEIWRADQTIQGWLINEETNEVMKENLITFNLVTNKLETRFFSRDNWYGNSYQCEKNESINP